MEGHDCVAMERLHAKGYISDPRSKAKSGRGDRGRVQRACKPFRKHFAKKESDRHQWQGFASTVSEPFRSGKRVRARITARQDPFRKERGTPCGYTSLRGLTGRAHARKNLLAIFGMSLSAPVGATPPQRGDPILRRTLQQSVRLNKAAAAFNLSDFTEKDAQDAASSFLTKFDPAPLSPSGHMTESTPGRRAQQRI
jgi:hypothetical protein